MDHTDHAEEARLAAQKYYEQTLKLKRKIKELEEEIKELNKTITWIVKGYK